MHAKYGKPWTGAELKVIKKIKASGETVKNCQHLLPNRSYCAIKNAVRRLPGPKKRRGATGWVFSAMERLLTETPGLTNKQMRLVIGCTDTGLQGVLNAERGKRVYVSGWVRSGTTWTAQYSLGDLPDAPRPERQSHEEALRKQRMAKRVKRGALNPFAVAMGQVSAPQGSTGRVYAQDMNIDQWCQSRRAA